MSQLPKTVIQGLQAFNQGKYYAAHEHFEDAWRASEDDTREFYRALLHISGGFYRLTQNRPGAARKFFARALHWLQYFPDSFLGFNIDALKSQLSTSIHSIDAGHPPDTLLKEWADPIQPAEETENDETIDHRL